MPGTTDDVVVGAGVTVNVPAGHTIHSLTTGAGTVVNESNLTITAATGGGANAGTLNIGNNTSLAVTSGFKNTGVVALNSLGNVADLQVNGGTLSLTAAGAGAHVDINGTTILGGTLTGTGGGTFNIASSTLGGTAAGAPVHITTGTTVNLANNNSFFIGGTTDNKGTIALNSAGNVTDTVVNNSGAKLIGGGAILLSDNAANRIFGVTGGTVLENFDNAISGAGQIFRNGGLSLVNTGTVDATGANALTLGLDIANNAGGLVVNTNTATNNGMVEALNGSAVTFNGSAIVANNSGGTLSGGIWRAISTGPGPKITTNAADIYLAGIGSILTAGGGSIDNMLATNNGSLRAQDGRQFTANGGAFLNNGLIELASGVAPSSFKSVASLTNSATGAITGYGTVGNQVVNAGLVQASLGNFAVTGAGTVQALAGATIDLSASLASNFAGNLLLATGGGLNLGIGNVTVGTDYDNANFGIGNTFNNHAGVTGLGLILASGTGLAMTVSGTGITGGATATPGLALGSVHVGSPLGGAFDINWNGSGAPSLRGAVQTTSGLSVSAPGFGAILPGGSAHEIVSVAGGAAGSLTGQSLKVVSNFDNVAAKTIAVTGAAYDFASHNPDLADIALAAGLVALSAQVNNFALSAFGKAGGAGTFPGGGTHYTLDFGSMIQGAASLSAALLASNAATGPADLLDGSYSLSGSGFAVSGNGPFSNLAAGFSQGGLNVLLSSATIGSFFETIDLSAIGHNASGYSAGVADVFLTLQGSVGAGSTGVPEPASWLMMLAGLLGLVAVRKHGALPQTPPRV